MNAEPLLARVAKLLARHRLDAVLIGNAAAALHGSPVTTIDLDFMFRETAANLRKLRALADDLDAIVMRPFYPASGLYRIMRDRDGLQLDFMSKLDGIRSFESLRSRASVVRIESHDIRVASLAHIIKRSVAEDRPADRGQLPPQRRHSVKRVRQRRRKTALRRESDRGSLLQIRRLLALPMAKRTNFLRRKPPGGGGGSVL